MRSTSLTTDWLIPSLGACGVTNRCRNVASNAGPGPSQPHHALRLGCQASALHDCRIVPKFGAWMPPKPG